MADELNLTLPERKKAASGLSKWIPALLFLLLIVAVANLVAALYGPFGKKTVPPKIGLSLEARKDLALKLEKQGLRDGAARAWREYLDQADIGSEERAKIWYRIGTIYQDAESHEQALEAYYRSEANAKIPDLDREINRRIQECLEAAAKFSALRYELAERVGVGEKNAGQGQEVLAEIGGYRITKAELDHRIEEQIDRQLATLAGSLTEEQKRSQKEAVLKLLSNAGERGRFLNQIVLEEILYRKAMEDKLAKDADVKAILRDMERALLAHQVLNREMKAQIKITEGDLRTYYEAHKEEYTEPEQIQISHILLKDREDVDTVLERLEKGERFEDLAKEFSSDEATKDKGGEIEGWIRNGDYIVGIGGSEEATRIIFGTDAGQVSRQAVESDRGFHIVKVRDRKPGRRPSFEEVKQEAYRALRSQKESEVREALLTRLKDRYNVVIHASKLRVEPKDDSQAGEAGKAGGKNAK